MPTIPPYVQFFGDLVAASENLAVLHEYILHMDQSLEDACTACKSSHQAVPASLESVAEDKTELLREPFPRLLHAGFVISVLIFLEGEMGSFVRALQRAKSLGLGLNDLSGSLAERFRKYCIHIAELPVHFSDQDWEDLRGVIEIRNCLVHNEGSLVEFSKANTIKAFAQRHGTPRIDNDGLLYLDKHTSVTVLEVGKRFMQAVYEAALTKYPEPGSQGDAPHDT